MNQYQVNCTMITGVGGRLLLKGQTYPENYFVNIEEHIANKSVTEMVEQTTVVEVPKN